MRFSKQKHNWYVKAITAIQHAEEIGINPFTPFQDTIDLNHLDITSQIGAALQAMGRGDILAKIGLIESVTTQGKGWSMLWYNINEDADFTDEDEEAIWTAFGHAVASGKIILERCTEEHFHLVPEELHQHPSKLAPDVEDVVAEFTASMEKALGPSLPEEGGDGANWSPWS